jgi:hypothetical protein
MIIWSGHGYLVAVFVFGVSLLMELGTESAFNDDDFYQREAWPFPLALIIASAMCFIVGRSLKTAGDRRLIDPETYEEVVVSSKDHTLFFVKVHWWGPILFVIAVVFFVQRIIAVAGAQ